MVTAEVVDDINALEEDEREMVLGLIQSFLRRNKYKTEAQMRFEEECKKYEGRNMTMEEIDALIYEARHQ